MVPTTLKNSGLTHFFKKTHDKIEIITKITGIHLFFCLVAGLLKKYIYNSWFPPHWKTLDCNSLKKKLIFSKKPQKFTFFLPNDIPL